MAVKRGIIRVTNTTHLTVGKEAVVKQLYEKYYRNETAALLLRISRDDGEEGESNSIQTQKMLLEKVAKEKGYNNLLIFSDDGVTGTTMKRPGFQSMIKEIERGYRSRVRQGFIPFGPQLPGGRLLHRRIFPGA